MAKKILHSGLTKLARCRPVILITTLHENGVVNAGTFGAYTNLSGTEIGIAIGKKSDTYTNIKRTGEFVINVLTKPLASASEVCAENLPPTQSEIEAAGLTAEPATSIKTPLIKECPVNIECIFEKELDIGAHSFVVGKCLTGHIEETALDVDGGLNVVAAQAIFGVRYPAPLYAVLSEPFSVE